MPLRVKLIGRYEILTEIGRGAMGVVYKARDPRIDRLVAIKTISLLGVDRADEAEFRQRFYQEARTAGRLSHPGIVTIFDVGTESESNAPYIVMEYVAGESLNNLVAPSDGRMQLTRALQLGKAIAEALHYAHGKGVIHRDIKPANILVTPLDQAKLADFGIARLDQSHLTLPGRLIGSPAFMSPEQLNGETIDGRSDLFSLGVVLYTIVTGHRPFQGSSTATVCFKLANQPALPASSWNPDVPPEIDQLLERAMAKDPAERFQTGVQMAAELEKCRTIRKFSEDMFVGFRTLIERPSLSSQPEQRIQQSGGVIPSLTQPSSNSPLLSTAPRTWAALGMAVLATVLCGFRFWRNSLALTPENGTASPTYKQENPGLAAVPQALSHATLTPPTTRRRIPSKQTFAIDHPIVPHQLEMASLDIEIQHGFEDAQASIMVDDRPVYRQKLHGVSTRRGLLFHKTLGRQSGSIALAPGKHEIRVQIQSAAADYAASKTLLKGFLSGSKATLRVKCDKDKNSLTLAID